MQAHNSLLALASHGQSVWLDGLERQTLEEGTFDHLIAEHGLAGITASAATFAQALAHTDDYQAAITELRRRGAAAEEIYERLAVYDVRRAAHQFRRLHHRSAGRDGYVSLELSPSVAHDSEATITEARRLWRLLDRPNIMVKVPATGSAVAAVQQLTRDGINVNITLLFSVERYAEVNNAYMTGLQQRLHAGEAIDQVASVASFCISRIDAQVDKLLDQLAQSRSRHAGAGTRDLHATAAIACAALAYQQFQERCAAPRWQALATRGARAQRPCWVIERDTISAELRYLDELVAPDTIISAALATLSAYRDHGDPGLRLQATVGQAQSVLRQLGAVGIELAALAPELEEQGVMKLERTHRQLLATLATGEPIASGNVQQHGPR
jgi:transaldolase